MRNNSAHPRGDVGGKDAVLVGLVLVLEQLPAHHGHHARNLAASLNLLGRLNCQVQLRACARQITAMSISWCKAHITVISVKVVQRTPILGREDQHGV